MTIDKDVAAQLRQLRRSRDVSLKALINDALRRGLRDMGGTPKKGKPFRTETFNAGKPLIDDIDNVAEVLAVVEGDTYK